MFQFSAVDMLENDLPLVVFITNNKIFTKQQTKFQFNT